MGLLLAGLAVAAFCLRTSMGSVPPILADIRDQFGLSTATAGVLLSMPIIGLGVGAPFGTALGRRLGDVGGLAASMLVLAAGCMLRAAPGSAALFAGTAVASAATGAAGVLVPAIAKRLNPERAGTLTGVYTALLIIGTSASSALSVPIVHGLDHDVRPALAIWALPALVAGVLLGLRRASAARRPDAPAAAPRGRWVWRDRIAWYVTGFLTFETIIFYSLFSWLPSIAHSHGVSATTAGAALSLFSLVGIPMSMFVPALADRRPNQGPMAVALSVVTIGGLIALLVSPGLFVVWAIVLGIAQGGAFGLALTLLVVRAPDGPSAAELAGMATSIAYFVAAGVSLLLGVLHDLTGSWNGAVLVVIAATVAQAVIGIAAGRHRFVTPPTGGTSPHGPDSAPRAH
jgi:CP family cyanate transporter-like MFS transporter